MSRKLLKHTDEKGERKIKIYWDSEWQEFTVQLFINDLWQLKADYFTEDKEDAYATSARMLNG